MTRRKTYGCFDRTRMLVRPLAERCHDLNIDIVTPLMPVTDIPDELNSVASNIIKAKENGAAVVMMLGGHVIRSGTQRFIIDLLERGYIDCLAANGAVVIHDYELALIGKTTENVARYIQNGRFGLWRETGTINDIVKEAHRAGLGAGEGIGRAIYEGGLPHGDISVAAAAYRCGVPFTVHVGIGYDIVHEHPNCDGAAWGGASYHDFLCFAKVLENLSNGVIMNFGSAVMGPEVFLKALAMVRNAAAVENRKISGFTSLVCDIKSLPQNVRQEAAKNNPDYYFRPWKTMLVRSLSGGGESYYVQGTHSFTIPALWTAITARTQQ